MRLKASGRKGAGKAKCWQGKGQQFARLLGSAGFTHDLDVLLGQRFDSSQVSVGNGFFFDEGSANVSGENCVDLDANQRGVQNVLIGC